MKENFILFLTDLKNLVEYVSKNIATLLFLHIKVLHPPLRLLYVQYFEVVFGTAIN